MTSPVCTIDATGIHKPAFADVLAYFQNAYRAIYGQDIYIENDSQDGQMIGIIAAAFDDCNAMAVQVYNAFSPSTAQGTGLSSVVKINGIARKVPSYSTADLRIVGQAGAVLTNCVASDVNSTQWFLPATVVIPLSGQIVVTATASQIGAVDAPAGTITTLATPTLGWQTVTNPSDAAPGDPVESDPALRIRQSTSAALPSNTVLDGIVGALLALPGVSSVTAYENDTNAPDSNGIPGHALAFVIEGGDAQAIASVIAVKKTDGAGTYGSTSAIYTNAFGIPKTISFFRPTYVPITWTIAVKALPGFTASAQEQIAQAVSDWTNGLGEGESIVWNRVYGAALLPGTPAAVTFEIQSIAVARDSNSPSAADVPLAFNEWASCAPINVVITVTT